ncbi:hypothetical protein ACFL5C_00450 [Candidatus Omnitrophota bacterium]
MKKVLKLALILVGVFLFLTTMAGNTALVAQEEGEDLTNDPAIQQALSYVRFDKSLLQEGATTTPAWLSYAFARIGWLNQNTQIPITSLTPENYQKSFEEELYGRESLIKVWDELKEQDATLEDTYLDEMVIVYKAGYLTEYVWFFTYHDTWKEAPTEERMEEFERWFTVTLPDHQPQTLTSLAWEGQSQ